MMTKTEVNQYLCAVLTTLGEVPFAPESSIYLALGCDREKFAAIKALLIGSGLATSSGASMSITPAGHAMAAKINEVMKVTK